MLKPFDYQSEHVSPTPESASSNAKSAALWDAIPDPSPVWAAANPGKFLAFLMVCPRDCTAIDELLSL